MDPIPTITIPIGAANLHSVLNWLIDQVNLQFENIGAPVQTPPEAFSLTVSVVRAPRPEPTAMSQGSAPGSPAPENHPSEHRSRR
jgi:hypothetical protein